MSTTRSRRPLMAALSAFCLIPAFAAGADEPPAGSRTSTAGPSWIWINHRPIPDQTVYFRKEFTVDGPSSGAKLIGSCDNRMIVYLNGERVAEGKQWTTPSFAEVTSRIRRGRNVLAV